ncbi:WhiB family transcriptional regulator [Streptomyces xanthophaeus]|uniref:WhiB family transcriptional regulator n=1 Tax=Streptomyces xanthophaeus TaxID=67385 RepID=UPI002647F2FE|nr:WhiB family transcriptional regulator [Streptomyces xanthophaeus]
MIWPAVPAWTAYGVCAQTDPDEFFPEKGEADKTRTAKRICLSCPVRQLCLDAAMASEGNRSASGRFGVWGGKSPKERTRLAKVRTRQMEAAA